MFFTEKSRPILLSLLSSNEKAIATGKYVTKKLLLTVTIKKSTCRMAGPRGFS